MAEYIRGVKIHIEIDTNKQTFVKDIENTGVEEVQRQYADFVTECFESIS